MENKRAVGPGQVKDWKRDYLAVDLMPGMGEINSDRGLFRGYHARSGAGLVPRTDLSFPRPSLALYTPISTRKAHKDLSLIFTDN